LLALVVALPFFELVLNTRTIYFVWQVLSLVVVLAYLSAMEPDKRHAAVRAVLPIAAAFEVLALTVAVSWFITGALDLRLALSATVFGLSGTYLLAGSVLRAWLGSAERASRVLVYGALLQVPVVAAQAMGLTVGLTGSLSGLSSTQWGGVIGAASLVRYPGSFGDYELFAEWLGILFILAVGGAMHTRGRTRTAYALCTAAILCLGLLTATRGFLVAVALAAIVVIPGALLSRRGRGFGGLVATAAAVLVAAYLAPETAVQGSVTRLLQTTTTGSNAFNRMTLFTLWGKLVARMPWFGYGWGAPALINAFAVFGVDYPHSLYFYFALAAGWPGAMALVAFVAAVILPAMGGLGKSGGSGYRTLVLGVAVVYWAVSEAKIEFVRLIFYGDLLMVLFGIVAADRWLSLRPAAAMPAASPRID
jgi:O-antigen ligase